MKGKLTLDRRGMPSEEGGSRIQLLALRLVALAGSLFEGVANEKLVGPTAIWIAAPKTFAATSEEITRTRSVH